MFSHSRLVFVLSGLILAGSAYSLAADSTDVPNELLGQLKRYAPLESNNLAERIGVQDSTDYLAALPVEMRDGAQLAGDVVLPRGSGHRGRCGGHVLRPAMMKPGKVYKVNMTGIVTASRFDTGHRLRIEITSSNFPGYERNLNTGGRNFDERNPSVATVRILHDRENASRLNLPVIN